jgi:hypothetical protein
VDESATGSVNFWSRVWRQTECRRRGRVYDRHVHLRAPSIDQGVHAFLWAVVFFLFLWFGMLAVGVSGATAFILALVAGAAIWLLVRTRGSEQTRPYGE